MDRQILNFTANEQILVCDNPIKISTNKVNYIEARFDLGQNWSGYDSVRAVWFNDFQCISTVLDSQGVTFVPFEVMKRRGNVKVNLVGSISENNVLTDRLTSYPVVAVIVDCIAQITGAETNPITPSQFEQFVQQVISEVEKVTGMTAQAETLPAGSQATARYENGILYLGIPQGIQGERGETGADGNGIAQVLYNADYSLTFVFTNGEQFRTPPIRGERGERGEPGQDGTDGRDGADGVTPNLSIGTVETLEPTQDAYVTRRGTDANPIFDFGIPKGDPGTVPDLDLILPTDTASGDIAFITDGQSIIPVESLKVSLEPIQDLHGYDKPWSGGAGKNKFDVDAWIVLSRNSNFYSVSNDVVSVIANDASGLAGRFIQLAPNTEYTISFTNASSGRVFDDNSETLVQFSVPQTSATFTTTASGQVAIKFYGTTYPTVIGKVQIEEGSTATSWTPYENICPISGHTECVTERTGKNLFDKDAVAQGKWLSTTTGLEETSTNYVVSDYIPVKEGKTVFIPNSQSARRWFYDENKEPKTYLNNSSRQAYTPTSDGFIRVSILVNGSSAIDLSAYQIELGATATAYEPYQGTAYTTTLGRTVYGGTLEQVGGSLTDSMAIIDMGTLAWRKDTSGGNVGFYITSLSGAKPPASWDESFNAVSEAFQVVPATGYSQYTTNGVLFMKSNGQMFAVDNRFTEASDFKTAMSGVQLCYELATPQTYQLTPQTISLLKGNNNVWSDGEIEMVYNADVGLYIDKKLGTSGTRTLSMTRTLAKSEDTDDTKSVQLAED